MNEARPVLDEDRLRRLVRELDAVVRRELPWFEGHQQDPGIALVELLAFLGESFAEYQGRMADEAYVVGRSPLVVTVDGSPWREVASLDGSGPDDAVYRAHGGDDGSITVRFGDGQHGRVPSTGSQVAATYRKGGGGAGVVAIFPWPPEPPLALKVQANSARISFAPSKRSWRDCLTRWFAARR
jgi:hypothetical protein